MATSRYTDSSFSQLRAPAQDAAAVVDVLGDPEIGGFAVTSVLDEPEYEIRRRMARFLAERDRDDVVVVYLSCHGVQDARGRLYFAATDTVKAELVATGVDSEWLRERLEECRALRQVVILDCCFSGAFGDPTKGDNDGDIELDRRLVGTGRGRVVLTASRASEYSFEGDPLSGAVTGRSVFTAALLDGLRSGAADRDGDGNVTVDEAYFYAADRVAAVGGRQSPQRSLYKSEGEIILARNPRGVTITPTKLPEAMQSSLDTSPHPLTTNTPADQAPEYHCTRVIKGHRARWFYQAVFSVAFSPDGLLLASSGGDGTVRLWNPATGEQVGHPLAGVYSVAFSPDGHLLASDCPDGMIRLSNTATGEQVGHPLAGVYSVAFSPDGRLLASGSGDGTVRLWNPATGEQVGHPLVGHNAWVTAVAFSPDGRLLASGSGDGTVRLWNPATGEQVGHPLVGHNAWVTAVAFSPDGRLLASGSGDGTVRLWNHTTGQRIGHPLTAHKNEVYAVVFSPDGSLLASGGDDGFIRLWNPATGQRSGKTLVGHNGGVYAVVFSPDGSLLASGSKDKTIRLWNR